MNVCILTRPFPFAVSNTDAIFPKAGDNNITKSSEE
jgi:hypothetical protein